MLGCKIGNIIGKNVTNFRYNIGDELQTTTGTIKIIEQYRDKRNHKNYKYKCLIDGYIGHLTENDYVNKNKGCPVCSGRKVLIGINDMWTTAPEQAKLLANIEDGYRYTQSANEFVDWKCPQCGNIIKHRKINNIYFEGLSCPKCGDGISYPEKFMYNVLSQLKIDFKYQYSPNWNGRQRYDFYIPDKQIIIETDGELHYKDNPMNGQTKEETQGIDKHKEELAQEHNIEVIRIKCYPEKYDIIKDNIIKSKLSYIYNLNNINWSLCQEYALSNLVIVACNLWMQGIHSTKQIGEKMNLHSATIIKYLKKGYICGYCDYQTPKQIKEQKVSERT